MKLPGFLMNRRRLFSILAIAAIVVFSAALLYARAGGAGGDSGGGGYSGGGSSGGGDGGGEIIWLLIMLIMQLPFPLNIIVAGAVIIGIIIFAKKGKTTYQQSSVLNDLPTGLTPKKAAGMDSFMKANPSFNEMEFKEKVRVAFMQIQEAWMNQDMSKARRFISDGVYQRFSTQFTMMKLLEQKNMLSNIQIKNIYIDAAETDGAFDILHVGIFASMNDSFVCEKDSSMNSSGSAEFVEFWSFLRRRGIAGKDIYHSDNCPSCGAPQKPMLDIGKCEYCNTLLNSGEYDWVLSEITQSDDYTGSSPKVEKARNLSEKVRGLIDENKDVAVQLLEDKASNGYLQIMTALAVGDGSIMRRFVSDDLYERLAGGIKKGETVSYNRMYLNDVSLIGVRSDEDRNYLSIAVKSTSQRIRIKTSGIEKIDQVLTSKTEIVIMARAKNATASKGSIYAHQCPSCGGTLKDTLDIKCQYCGNVLNSGRNEWIIVDVMSTAAYAEYAAKYADSFAVSVDASAMDSLYDVRDFAMINLIVLVTADGVYTQEEDDFLKSAAKKWGYGVDKIQGLFMMAKSGLLAVKMPDDMKSRRKIYAMLEKAAAADGTIAPQEQALLDQIRKDYLSGDAA